VIYFYVYVYDLAMSGEYFIEWLMLRFA
jgi:hypothetical protein